MNLWEAVPTRDSNYNTSTTLVNLRDQGTKPRARVERPAWPTWTARPWLDQGEPRFSERHQGKATRPSKFSDPASRMIPAASWTRQPSDNPTKGRRVQARTTLASRRSGLGSERRLLINLGRCSVRRTTLATTSVRQTPTSSLRTVDLRWGLEGWTMTS